MAGSTLVVNPAFAASTLIASPSPADNFVSMGAYCDGLDVPGNLNCKQIQVFVATVGKDSSMVPLEVCKLETIASVKIRIQARRGFVIDQQRLVYAGKELKRDEWLLQDYGVRNGDVLHLVLLVPELMSLTLRTANGDSFVYKVWQAEDSNKSITDKGSVIAVDHQQVVTLRGEQDETSSIKEEFSFKGDFVLCLRVHRPKVRSKSLGQKEVELVVTPSDDAAFPDGDASSGVIPYAEIEQPSCHGVKVCGEQQHLQQLIYGLQQPAEISLPSKYPISFDLPNSLKELVELVRMGLHAGQVPCLTSEGSGGVYLMKDECGMRNVAVFKPMDEEPMSVNNPRGYSASTKYGEGLKKGTRSGEGAIREVAAYVLDHPMRSGVRGDVAKKDVEGFSGVPPTTMVRCYHEAFHYGSDAHKLPKKGSLQQFVHAISSCEDMGSSMFPVNEVHKITVLDLRLANTDRNGGNILVCKGKDGALRLVPIDHGYCLPDKFEDCSFEWLYWPQAQQPYAPSTVEYINSLDVEEDLKLLQHCGWSPPTQVARNFRISTMLLKKGAAAGLTPFEIGSIMSRSESLDSKSSIELILEKVEARNLKEHAFLEVVAELVDEHIATLKR